MTETLTAPKQLCRRCNGELAYDEKRNCKFCPICYPPNRKQPAPIKEEKKYLDVKLTEKRAEEIAAKLIKELVPDMIREELENWHIPEPSVKRNEINELTSTNNAPVEPKVDEETWLQKAKRLSVPTHYEVDGSRAGGMRKKADILADIERAENGRVGDTEDQSGS